jgi:hypothetical protein
MRKKALKALAVTKWDAKPYFPTVSDCHLWTSIINYLLFGGLVPKYRKVTVKRMNESWGHCIGVTGTRGQRYCRLEIADRFPSFASFYSILLHELVHASEWTQKGQMSHGNFFLSHRELAAKVGVKLRIAYR